MFTLTDAKTPLDSVPWYGRYRASRGRAIPLRPGQEKDHDRQNPRRLRLRAEGRLPLQSVHLPDLRLQLKDGPPPARAGGVPPAQKERAVTDLTIAKLARAGAVGVETIRYYQRRGLLAEPPRAGAVRRYGPGDVRRLLFIRRAQAAGFTLEAIAELLALDKSDDRARVRALAAERLAALEAKIAELESARAALTRLSRACAAGVEGPCPIIEAFEA